ncbi:MAG TPA: 3-hydroxyacyl-ACP dehydratase FabZ [Terriglobales bacterium]|jgi:3-hydroxyacyl-[acyl-carrier-protein] dehydratase|nr:3-hydroxyacyl-ACP dehydratase FabZ [Terriglobales bacterium]
MTDTAHPSTYTPAPAPAKTTLDIIDIFHILPHRFPFLLIDRVIEIQRKHRIVAIKNVTINEPFFAGHFPNLPIMPGVLIVEAIAQAGGALLLTEVEDRSNKVIMFTGIERARFRRPVVPGDQLRIEVELKNWKARSSMIAVRMEGIAYVGEKRVTEAIVSCQLVDSSRGRSVPANGADPATAEPDEAGSS